MSLPTPLEKEVAIRSGRYMVVIHNDDTTPYLAVISVLIAATGCDRQEAEIETWEAHTYGKAPVHFSSQEECEIAARIIRSIGVKVNVLKEWDD